MKNAIVNHGRKLVPVLPLAAFLMTAPALWHWAYPPTASAQITAPLPWTSIGAGGTVDELSLPDFGFSPPGLPNGQAGPSAGYRFGSFSITPLEFRYNVTNTEKSLVPGWTILELGATAPGTSTVRAQLWKVRRCDGIAEPPKPLCQIVMTGIGPPGECRRCQFAPAQVDFSNYLYYVRVQVDRNYYQDQPQVHTLRIY